MEKQLSWRTVWSAISIPLLLASAVSSAPIKIDFSQCHDATFQLSPDPKFPTETYQCCPPKPIRPILDGPPPPSTNFTRVRPASQCTDAIYGAKLEKAYALLRALPDDDPRSFKQQWHLHCSYCGGAFSASSSSGISKTIDIHFSWFFFPWHRWYLFFHERILQSVLGDPTFSLGYWNWDSPYSVGDGSSKDGVCLKAGHNFPALFNNCSSSLYDVNRSEMAKGNSRFHFPDLNFKPDHPAVQQRDYNMSEEYLIASNLNTMYQTMVSGGITAETFMGGVYRAGEPSGNVTSHEGEGLLEGSVHASVHLWVGQDPPVNVNDMGQLAHAARDPIFFAHHANIDRLWTVWKSIGREDHTDPDFLNAEFLFYDENKDLRRVTVAEALDTKKLGYVYQRANDDAWIHLNQPRCSNLTYLQLLAQAESLLAPTRDSEGYYELKAGKPLVMVIDRPDNPHGLEEFLKIDGIELDRSRNTGFDVFLDLPNADDCSAPSICAEYSGRFTNMAQCQHPFRENKALVWKESITRTLVDIQAPIAPSRVVITLVPFSQPGDYETIKFTDITISQNFVD